MLTGLLFGQDLLYLKSGEVYSGTFIGKVGKDIVFNVFVSSSVSSPNWMEGVRNKKKFPIWDVETIVTNNGELTYPFDIPKKDLSKQDMLFHKSGKNYKGSFLGKVDEKIIFKLEGEKSNSAFSINDVDIVITSRGGIKVELYYPFDIETKQEYPFDISTKKEGNDLARIASQFFFNPTPLQQCMTIPCGFIVFIIVLALNPGSDS